MALENLAAIQAAYAELLGDKVTSQINRKSVLLSRIRKEAWGGPTCAWDVTFSGATASTFTEGADVSGSDLAQDVDQMATLAWGEYRSNFGMSGLAKAVAASSRTSPGELLNRFVKDMMGSAGALGKHINGDLYAGTGSDHIIGLQTALAASGTYAGLSKSTYSEWAGNVNANGGTDRALSKALLDEVEGDVYDASGDRFDIFVTTSNIARKYESLFDAQKQVIVVNDQSVSGPQNGGVPYNVAAGETGLTYKGVGVLRDSDCPAGHIFLLNSEQLCLRYVPVIVDNDTGAESSLAAITDGEESMGIMAHLQFLSKAGDSDKYSLVVYPQLKVARVNAHAMISDIDES